MVRNSHFSFLSYQARDADSVQKWFEPPGSMLPFTRLDEFQGLALRARSDECYPEVGTLHQDITSSENKSTDLSYHRKANPGLSTDSKPGSLRVTKPKSIRNRQR